MRFETVVWRNLQHRPWRAILTCLGMAIATCTVVAIMTVAYGHERVIAESFLSSGVDLIVQRAGTWDPLGSNLSHRLRTSLVGIPGVRDVSGMLFDMIDVENVPAVTLRGLEPDSRLFNYLSVLEGNRLEARQRQGVMLGRNLARSLGKKVGDSLTLYDRNDFKVVGIYKGVNALDDGAAVLLLADLQELMTRHDQVTAFAVTLEQDDDVRRIDRVISQINDVGHDLLATSTKDHVRNLSTLRLLRSTAWMTSAIALIVGTVGILNAMFMSVTERTREIGILRAIGWKKSRVARLIFAESLSLSIGGSILGALGAIMMIRLLTQLPTVSGYLDDKISWTIVATGLGLSLVMGMMGAALPALHAASLAPMEAMRK